MNWKCDICGSWEPCEHDSMTTEEVEAWEEEE
jgi:hypothetical protein